MKHVALIQGHPDPARGHLCHALADAYANGARTVGAEVTVIELGQLEFPLLRTQDDFQAGAAATPAALVPAQGALLTANHIVLVYPLWLGTMPALLKGFLEQVLRPGIAMMYPENGFPTPGLRDKSARVIVTMGMPALAYRWYYGAHSLRSLEHHVLRFCGIRPVHESLFGMVENVTEARRLKWLAQVEAAAERDLR